MQKVKSACFFFYTNCTKTTSKMDLWQIFKIAVTIYGHPVLNVFITITFKYHKHFFFVTSLAPLPTCKNILPWN